MSFYEVSLSPSLSLYRYWSWRQWKTMSVSRWQVIAGHNHHHLTSQWREEKSRLRLISINYVVLLFQRQLVLPFRYTAEERLSSMDSRVDWTLTHDNLPGALVVLGWRQVLIWTIQLVVINFFELKWKPLLSGFYISVRGKCQGHCYSWVCQ